MRAAGVPRAGRNSVSTESRLAAFRQQLEARGDWELIDLPRFGDAGEAVTPEAIPHEVARLLAATSGRRTLASHENELFRRLLDGENLVQEASAPKRLEPGLALAMLSASSVRKDTGLLHLCEDTAALRLVAGEWKALSKRGHDLGVTVVSGSGDVQTVGPSPEYAQGHVVVTTFTGLETAILSNEALREACVKGLRWIVVDGIDTHRGSAGSRAAYLVHRVLRLAAQEGVAPSFLALASLPRLALPGYAEAWVGKPFAPLDTPGRNERPGLLGIARGRGEPDSGDGWCGQMQSLVAGAPLQRLSSLWIVPSRREVLAGRRALVEAGIAHPEVCTPDEVVDLERGSVDVVVTAAFPGSVGGLWQQLLLARPSKGMALWLPAQTPTEQLLARRHRWLSHDEPRESPCFDPVAIPELFRQLPHAAAEQPLREGQGFANVEPAVIQALVERLEEDGVLRRMSRGESTVFVPRKKLAPPLRRETERRPPAPQADAFLSQLETWETRTLESGGTWTFGEVNVTEARPGAGTLAFQSTSAWLTLAATNEDLSEQAERLDLLGRACIPLVAFLALCDEDAVGFASDVSEKEARLYLYDREPGGAGIARRAFDTLDEVLRGLRDLVDGCRCEDGCTACIGAHEGRGVLRELLSSLGQTATH